MHANFTVPDLDSVSVAACSSQPAVLELEDLANEELEGQ